MPCAEENFSAFTPLACERGRNFLHPNAVSTILDAYALLRGSYPKRLWHYGDLGFQKGGRLAPHRTHQNGLSADFFVPVVSDKGHPAALPFLPDNRFGYGIEFDRHGRWQGKTIDFGALGDHLLALEQAGKSHGVRIKRIILDPRYHDRVLKARPALRLLATTFNRHQAWVRHDEHYHVDFELPARLRKPLRCKSK